MDLTISQEEYESLVTLARAGCPTIESQRQLESWIQKIEKRNGITRYQLWVQWQEADSVLPPTTRFPDTWPPELRFHVQLMTRPIAKADVDAVIRRRARNPVSVLVTPDPAALLGWTAVEDYFTQ